MAGFLSGQIDAAQAMTYNEYAQVLEAKNPATGKLYTAADFNVISWNDVGTTMLQDAIWADTSKLKSDPDYEDTAVKLLKASIKGWVYCRDNPQQCADIVVKAGSELGASHQLWQMNEINKLIWPSPNGIGVVDQSRLGPDRPDRPEHQERRGPDGPDEDARRRRVQQQLRPDGPDGVEGRERRRDRRRLPADHRRAEGERRVVHGVPCTADPDHRPRSAAPARRRRRRPIQLEVP